VGVIRPIENYQLFRQLAGPLSRADGRLGRTHPVCAPVDACKQGRIRLPMTRRSTGSPQRPGDFFTQRRTLTSLGPPLVKLSVFV
jgi:hypothetical protein